MALTASLSCAACLTCRWETGWSLRTWGPTPSQPPPPSMASKNRIYTTSCPALPGAYVCLTVAQLWHGGAPWRLMSKPPHLLQAIRAADLLPGNAGPCGGVVPFRGGRMWPGKQLGRADEALPSQRGLKVANLIPDAFSPSLPPLKILLDKTSRPVVQISSFSLCLRVC